jgi:hypothetical protein
MIATLAPFLAPISEGSYGSGGISGLREGAMRAYGHVRRAVSAITLMVAIGAFLVMATADAATGQAVLAKGTPCSMAGSDINGNLIDGGFDVVTLKVENPTSSC